MTSEPLPQESLGECDGCGADLFEDVDHDCVVLGTVVRVKRT